LKSFMKFIPKKFVDDENFNEIIRGSFVAFILRIGGVFFSFLLILVVSKGYGAEGLGIFSLSLTLLHVAVIFGEFGADIAMMKFVSEFEVHKKWGDIFRLSKLSMRLVLSVSVLLSIVVFIYSNQIAEVVFNKEYLSKYFKIISFAIVPNVLLMLNAEKLRGLKEIKKYSFLKNISFPMIATILITISLFITKNDVIPISAYLISMIFSVLLSFYLWNKSISKRVGQKFDLKKNYDSSNANLKKLLNFAIPMLLTNSMALIMSWADIIMIGILRTAFEVGIYKVPSRLAIITSTSFLAFNVILAPKISELWKKGKMEEIRSVIKKSTVLIFWTSLPVSLVFGIFHSQILGLFGMDFKAGAFAMIILILGQFFNFLVGPSGLLLIVMEKQYVIQNIIVVGTAVNIAMNYFLIPVYGINGAAFASMISMIFVNIISMLFVKKFYGFYTISRRMFLLK